MARTWHRVESNQSTLMKINVFAWHPQQSAAAMEAALSSGASWGMQEDAVQCMCKKKAIFFLLHPQQSAAAMEAALSSGASWGMQEDAVEDPEEGGLDRLALLVTEAVKVG